jgi:hypothetical protein
MVRSSVGLLVHLQVGGRQKVKGRMSAYSKFGAKIAQIWRKAVPTCEHNYHCCKIIYVYFAIHLQIHHGEASGQFHIHSWEAWYANLVF